MYQTTLKVALAGLLHDIGKLAENGLEITREYIDNNAGLYRPKQNGHYTHRHALFTAAFIEKMSELLPPEFNSSKWGEGDSFINLAAMHHKPETAMQWIITVADRISSGLDRATFEEGEKIAYKDFKKTRLLPVIEALGPERCRDYNSAHRFKYEYALEPVSTASIFPRPRAELDTKEASDQYNVLFQRFVKALSGLYHRDNVELFSQHLDSLLMIYTSLLPACRAGDVVHDVSLYDHLKTTSAIAIALFQYHKSMGTMNEKHIQNDKDEKFLLIGGDFYGIQDFIFSMHGDTRKLRSKLLRGRSFGVTLLTELAARLICKRLGLPYMSILLSAAGKFHILAPNLDSTWATLDRCEQEINDWLFERTYGETSIGISRTVSAPKDFTRGSFRRLWDEHLQNVEEEKYHKIDLEACGGVVEHYFDTFDHALEPEERVCPLCAKRPANVKTKDDWLLAREVAATCSFCRDHVYLGEKLVKNDFVAIYFNDRAIQKVGGGELLEPIFGMYQLEFHKDWQPSKQFHPSLSSLWQIGVNEDGSIPTGATAKPIRGHVPWFRAIDNDDDCLLESAKKENKREEMIEQIREGAIKTFSHIAVKSRTRVSDGDKVVCHGIEALGVLKGDVDHLGMLFGCGLSDERFTISRLATLNRQLESFFSLYLPHKLAVTDEYFDTYTVFSGGDDLFLIGPWNRMAALALEIRDSFARFACNNDEITISMGITIRKPNTPVDAMAEEVETALKSAKNEGRNRITMFGQTMKWDDFRSLLEKKKEMEMWLDQGFISDVMFYKLNDFIHMAQMEERLTQEKRVSIKALGYLKWPALFRYHLERNVMGDKDQRKIAIEEVGKAFEWIKTYKGGVRIPLWHILYEKRKN